MVKCILFTFLTDNVLGGLHGCRFELLEATLPVLVSTLTRKRPPPLPAREERGGKPRIGGFGTQPDRFVLFGPRPILNVGLH